MPKFQKHIQRRLLDPETGEEKIIEDEKEWGEYLKEDSFYTTFVKYIAPFYNLKSDTAKKLLVWLCEHAEYNTGKINLSANLRQKILKDTGIKTNNTITNNLKILKNSKLISGEKGEFEINPQIFWKGELKIRREILKKEEFKIKFSIGEK